MIVIIIIFKLILLRNKWASLPVWGPLPRKNVETGWEGEILGDGMIDIGQRIRES